MKRLLNWLRLFPGTVFPDWSVNNYLKAARVTMKNYDMVSFPSEDYFTQRYMHIIDGVLKTRKSNYDNLKVLDCGCGQGRLSLEFLKRGSTIVAIDALEELLDKAKAYVKKAKLKDQNIKLVTGKIPEALTGFSRESFDLIICTEVLYMVPNPQDSIKIMIELLAPGGVIIFSLRTRLYYLLFSLLREDFNMFKIACSENNFYSIGKSLSWFDPADFNALLENFALVDIKKWGIGILSGIQGDPTSRFCVPHKLKFSDKLLLAKAEDSLAGIYPDSGRYIVFSAAKPKNRQ